MIIKTFKFDGDPMSVYNLITAINMELESFSLSLVVDDEEHDGYDVVTLSEIRDDD